MPVAGFLQVTIQTVKGHPQQHRCGNPRVGLKRLDDGGAGPDHEIPLGALGGRRTTPVGNSQAPEIFGQWHPIGLRDGRYPTAQRFPGDGQRNDRQCRQGRENLRPGHAGTGGST